MSVPAPEGACSLGQAQWLEAFLPYATILIPYFAHQKKDGYCVVNVSIKVLSPGCGSWRWASGKYLGLDGRLRLGPHDGFSVFIRKGNNDKLLVLHHVWVWGEGGCLQTKEKASPGD